MLKHQYTVLCRESKIDADTNSLSILDIYDSLQLQAELPEDAHLNRKKDDPLVFPFQFEITSVFYRDDTDRRYETDLEVKAFDPNGKLLGVFPAHLTLEKGMRRMRSRIRSDRIALTISGIYEFEVYLKSDENKFKKVESVPLEVYLDIK
jgi:hypothetical protein